MCVLDSTVSHSVLERVKGGKKGEAKEATAKEKFYTPGSDSLLRVYTL